MPANPEPSLDELRCNEDWCVAGDCNAHTQLARCNEALRAERERSKHLQSVLEDIESTQWREVGPEAGGPIDVTPKERGMLLYIGSIVSKVRDALRSGVREGA